MIVKDGIEYRNLVEQVRKNQEDIARHYEIDRVLADWGIKVIGRLDTWEIPTGSFEYGDAYAVGPEGGPFDFYIYTRGTPDYWLNYGSISIVGPQGPQGEPGPQGEQGKSSKWYVGQNEPTGNIQPNDMWLRVNNDGTTNGFVYAYQNGAWALYTSILGPTGPRGPQGATGPQGPAGARGPQGPAGNPSPVINIIAELPEGSVISDTYDPANVPSNSGVLMPVGGVNHLWIIINGIWTDSGSWGQGGTRVYVGGEEVIEFNADTKLDKISESGARVYTSSSGIPSSIVYTDSIVANTIPIRRDNNNFRVGTPKKDDECATKKYVDDAISAVHGEIQHANVIWYPGREIIEFTLNVGVLKDSILSAGDLTAWGGYLYFYSIGGLVYVNDSWVDNDSIVNRLYIRCDTGDVELQGKYATSESYTILANFSLNEAEIYESGNIDFSMTFLGSGLNGGAFTFNSIPG